jgi:tryptophan synthase alpha chain
MKGIYIVGGYPDKDSCIERIKDVADAGYDFIEIGIPYNDPTADGPVIAETLLKTIDLGVTSSDILEILNAVKDLSIKKYVMTYGNIIHAYGIEKFSQDFSSLINGLIIADCPNRMSKYFYDNGLDITIIPFATPETRERDIEEMKNTKADFIYFVGIRGTTGSKADFSSEEMKMQVDRLRKVVDTKIMIGFGIKTSQDVKDAMKLGDGFVVGTEAVKRQENEKEFKKYIGSLI